MGFYATGNLPEVAAGPRLRRPTRTNPLKKSRLGFFSATRSRAGFFASQPVEPHRETPPTLTKTALGLSSWLSRDPIGELGGLNLYMLTQNNPMNEADALGLGEVKNNSGAPLVIISSFEFNFKVDEQKGKCCDDDAEDKVSAVPLPLASGVDTDDLNNMGDVDAIIGPDGAPYKTGGSQDIEVGPVEGGDFDYNDVGGIGGKGKKPTSDFWVGGNIINRCDGAISQLSAVQAKAAECPEDNKEVIQSIDRLIKAVEKAKQILQSQPYSIK